MTNQHKITEKHKLLNEKGEIIEKGYSTKLLLDYSRKDIKASSLRVKEWDYYFIGGDDFGIALCIADNSYMGIASASFIDYHNKKDITDFAFIPFPMGRMKMPSSSISGDVCRKSRKIDLRFLNDGIKRRLYCNIPRFDKGKGLLIDIELTPPEDSMVIATPFAYDKKAFYYNQKINCMTISGGMVYGSKEYDLSSHLATLDWGRGVWTYDNTWYWGSMSSRLPDNSLFGFNIGYGFGDTSAASENMLFYNGKAHKISLIEFGIPFKDGKEDYMDKWHFTSDDKRLEMTFIPLFDRRTDLNALIIAQDAHQVFGKFTGAAVLDDGSKISFSDCLGFAEKVRNRW